MDWGFLITNSILLGVGLAVDAFSVSIANAIAEPSMPKGKKFYVALTYALFQIAMPLIGWVCVHTISQYFTLFQKFIPYIALVLLCYIGIKMLVESGKGEDGEEKSGGTLTLSALIIQGIATSIDALSVGFAIADYTTSEALISSIIIGIVTFFICTCGLWPGKKAGEKLKNKATLFGGIVLILIGIEIFIKDLFF